MGIDGALEYCQRNPETSILAVLPTKRTGEVEIVTSNLNQQLWQPIK